MRVLVIGSDRSLFQRESAAAERQRAYAQNFEAVDIVVFTRQSQKLAPQTLATGLHVHPTASRNRRAYVWDAIRIARNLPRPDVISVQDPFEAGIVGLFVARRTGAPLHVQIHTDFFAPGFVSVSFLNRIRVFLARFVLRRAARIRVVSERIKRGVEENYHPHASISVLPIFVDVKKFRTARADSLANEFVQFRRRLLVVARLEREKNVRLAIDSFAHTAPEDTCLIIVGEGNERRVLEKQVAHHHLQSRVFFEGDTDPLPYYALADLIMVTSIYEGYGLVIVEALAAGKPVLSTDVGVARESGAIVTGAEKFESVLGNWFEEGMRTGKLLHYPYPNFESYVQAYCDDLAACTGQ